ncbi:hypothetical protein HLH33_00575 [Gluconacetobacter diazotrophicus]|uniref:Uncharacterized protein n=1 Tax=Gluconacetobacter diazotrophicus TaxID=33996 RepID=A0A7W4FBQ2_GLUDI|nr:hypothetical protein [Gluconacetobacter diazotrophicus]MBB2154815.1 hypothetical protein [Gluconacetobacter diazotrophicus]
MRNFPQTGFARVRAAATVRRQHRSRAMTGRKPEDFRRFFDGNVSGGHMKFFDAARIHLWSAVFLGLAGL